MTQSEIAVVRDLFLHWSRHTLERDFQACDDGLASDGKFRFEVRVRTLVDFADPPWQKNRGLLEQSIGDGLPVRAVLWVPAGADLPTQEPAFSEFADIVRRAAIRLGPGERSHVQLPITIKLRKSSDVGGVVSVTGGLNPHWARFTDRVRGTFDMDSTALHRLPESDEFLESLIGAIVERANSLDVGEVGVIDATDSWTLQRLEGDPGFEVVGLPAVAATDMGMTVRRSFRRILRDEGPSLRETSADVKALVVVGHYPRVEQEGATTAMRGYDPASYSGIDFVCLACDGLIKPLIQPPVNALPWTSRAAGA
jgi:hypothetical protein